MNMLTRALALMARAGVHMPAAFRPGKHNTTTTHLAGIKGPKRKRLQMARGAGSINAKADILQLARAGRWNEAADMDQEHEHQCGERLFGPEIRKQWREYAIEEALTS